MLGRPPCASAGVLEIPRLKQYTRTHTHMCVCANVHTRCLCNCCFSEAKEGGEWREGGFSCFFSSLMHKTVGFLLLQQHAQVCHVCFNLSTKSRSENCKDKGAILAEDQIKVKKCLYVQPSLYSHTDFPHYPTLRGSPSPWCPEDAKSPEAGLFLFLFPMLSGTPQECKSMGLLE